jgi:glyoxalase family protein
VPREQRGTRSITRTGLRVHGADTLAWWAERLTALGVRRGQVVERDGRPTLDFEDPEGQRLALVEDGGAGDPPVAWERSPVPGEHQIRGLGPITMSVPTLRGTERLLTEVLGMRPVREYVASDDPRHTVHVFAMGADDRAAGPHAELHVAVHPTMAIARAGAGGVHHVAFRCPDADYHAWTERLATLGVPNSGEVDRHWFHSLYLREPNGVLFEIATDGPGFAVDEPAETLGEHVVLAPFLEPERERIVAALKPID